MNFWDRDPSSDWMALTFQGEVVAEAWFKPDGEPSALVVRVPRERLEVPDLTQRLTTEDLLAAADIPNEAVEAWRFRDESYLGLDGANPELKCLLPSPPAGETQLTIHIRIKSPAEATNPANVGQGVSEVFWQDLETKWKTILGLEAAIDSLRLSVDGVRAEMEAAFKRAMTVEEKIHALQSDVVQWNKAKSRIHYSLPKAREFIHRATWASGLPERKRLDEIMETHIAPRVPFPELERLPEQLAHLQKDRQVLQAQGNSVNQECRAILAELQRALGMLQRNAADNARKKRSASREKGKHL